MNPCEHDSKSDDERIFVRADDVPMDAPADITHQRIAIDRLGPRLNTPVPVQGRGDLFTAALFKLGVDGMLRHTKLFGGLLLLAG
jgi:hypothetical protein